MVRLNNKIYLLAIVTVFFNSAYSQETRAKLSANLPFLNKNERVLVYTMPFGSDYDLAFSRRDSLAAHNGNFLIDLPIANNNTFINIQFENHSNYSINNYLISPGDNISLSWHSGKYYFTGTGSTKYKIMSSLQAKQKVVNMNSVNTYKDLIPNFEKSDINLRSILNYLKQRKKSLKKLDYSTLKSEMILANEYAKRWILEYRYSINKNVDKEVLSAEQKKLLLRHLEKSWTRFVNSEDSSDITRSPSYASFYQLSYKIDSCLLKDRPYTNKAYALTIKNKYLGKFRDKLMVHLFYSLGNSLSVSNDCFGTLLTAIDEAQEGEFKNKLQALVLKKTEVLPDFAYEDISGKVHHLTEFRGKAIIVDTWHPGCGPCRAMAPALKEIEKKWRNNPGIVFMSICNSVSKVDWLNNLEKYSNNEVLNLSIEKPENDHFFSIINPELSDPTLVLIDGNGRIYSYLRNPLVDDGREINDKITQVLNQLKK